MFQREITALLREWKKDPKHKCMMVRGARQVEKTFSISDFGKTEYDSFINVNFIETPSLLKIFSQDLDTATLLRNFSLYLPDAMFIPEKPYCF